MSPFQSARDPRRSIPEASAEATAVHVGTDHAGALQTRTVRAGRPSLFMIGILLAASALFFFRGPWRAMHGGGGDFAAPYVAGLRFLRGENPYTSANFEATWHAAGAKASAAQNASGLRPIYPPSTLILMAPFSGLPWYWALGTYELLCTLLYGALLVRLAREVGSGWNSWATVGFVAWGIALSPIHTGLGVGNVSILAFLLGMYCMLLGRARKDFAAAVILSLCFCLKLSVGAPVLLYWLICRRWKLTVWASLLITVISGLAMLRMFSIPKGWLVDYRSNVQFLFGPSGVANFTDSNAYRFDLLNLQVPLYALTHSTVWSEVLTWAVVSVVVAIWLRCFMRQKGSAKGWAEPGVLLLLGLLPIYQRNYNSGFVLVALLWGFQHLGTRVSRWILLCGVVFLLPGEALLRRLGEHLPLRIANGFVMDFFILPQASWALLAIIVLLLYGMWHEPIDGIEGVSH